MPSRSLARTVLTTTLTVVAVVVVLYLIYLLRTPLAWLAIASFVAVALSGPVSFFERRLRRGSAVALTYLLLLLVPIGLLAIVVPPLVREGSKFIDHVPRYAQDASNWVQRQHRLRSLDKEYDITGKIKEKATRLPNKAGDAAQWLGGLGVGVVNSAFAGLTILILSVFMVANGRRWLDALLRLQPPGRARRLRSTLDSMATAIGAYVAGELMKAFVAGITTLVVLLILGVPFAAPLAVIVGLFDLIPMVGATLAAVFVGVITLFADFPLDTVIWTVWAIVYQQIENNVVQPRIQKRAVGVHPFGVIVAVLFGGTLFGVPGAILAVPFAAMLQIGVKDLWAWRREAEGAEPAAAGG